MTTLEQKLERTKNRIGLINTRLRLERPTTGRGLYEGITQDWKEITIKIREDIDLAPDKETKRYLKELLINDPIETVAEDLLYHGCGHRELPRDTGLGCPYRTINHDNIMNGIARALKKIRIKYDIPYLANMFEDIIDNTNARTQTRHAGQILFWNREHEETNIGYTKLYEAFVRINLNLWGSAIDHTLLRRHFSKEKKVNEAVEGFKNYLKKKLNSKSLIKLYTKKEAMKKLFDYDEWEDMAYNLTLSLKDLLKEERDKSKEEESIDIDIIPRLCFGHKPGEPSPWDERLKLPGEQEEITFLRYKAGKGPSEHREPITQLDALYRKISRSIPVKTSSYLRAQGIPIARYGKRFAGEDEVIKPGRVKGIGFKDNKLTLKVGRHELRHPAHYKVHPRNLPKLRIALLDTSSSMGLSPEDDNNIGNTSFIPWGDNSKYHYALKGIYGIDNFLHKQGISHKVDCEAVIFGDATETSGRVGFRSEEERRILLRRPSGGTEIDIKTLEESTKTRLEERCFLISISDGDIINWNKMYDKKTKVKDKFKEAIIGTDYCHIQIGPENQFTRDLESWGFKVERVKGDDDLSRLMIDTATSYYKAQ